MKIYEVTVPYLTTVKHIVKVDPDNMPPLATSPANYARIIAEERNIKENSQPLLTKLQGKIKKWANTRCP